MLASDIFTDPLGSCLAIDGTGSAIIASASGMRATPPFKSSGKRCRMARSDNDAISTRGTASYLRAHGLNAEIVFKVNEGRPHVGDEILNDKIQMVINTPLGRESFFDDRTVRRIAMMHGVLSITTLTGAAATVNAIKALRSEGLAVRALQEYHAETTTRNA